MKLYDWICTIQLSKAQQKIAVIGSIVFSSIASILTWLWWVSFNRPNPIERPHAIMWDIVSVYLRSKGTAVAQGINGVDDNPLVRLSAFALEKFGGDYMAMTFVQLPFLIILIASCGMIGWRTGGRFAGFIAPWIVIFAPMTLGLSVYVDDLLAIQACVCMALAMVAWSDAKKLRWLPFLSIVPISFGVAVSTYSNGMFLILVFCVGSVSFLIMQWDPWEKFQKENGNSFSSVFSGFPLLAALGVLLALIGGIAAAFPIPYDYFLYEAARPDYREMGVASKPAALLAYPGTWFKILAGPTLSVVALFSIAIAFFYKKINKILAPTGWILGPVLLLTIINKRHDWYIAAAVPATYIIVATGISSIKSGPLRGAIAGLIIILLFFTWGLIGGDLNDEVLSVEDPFFRRKLTPYIFPPAKGPCYKSAFARKIINQCGPKSSAIVFANNMGINGLEAFYIWHIDPKIRVGDVLNGPLTEPDPCVVAFFNQRYNKPYTLNQVLFEFRQSTITKENHFRALIDRLDVLEKDADKYVLAPAVGHGGNIIFTHKDNVSHLMAPTQDHGTHTDIFEEGDVENENLMQPMQQSNSPIDQLDFKLNPQ